MGNTTGRFSLAPRVSTFVTKKSSKKKKMKTGRELLTAPFTNQCTDTDTESFNNKSVHECYSVRRLIMVLDWYNNMRSIRNAQYDMDKLLSEYADTYTNLLNDYHHILNTHLNSTQLKNDENFLFIYNKLCKRIECDVKTCKQYTRLNIPNRLSNIKGYNLQTAINSTSSDNNAMDIVQFYKELLDVMHCYFMHAFDLGLRVSIFDEEEDMNAMHASYDNDDNDEAVKLLEQDHDDSIERKDESMIDFREKLNLETKEEERDRLYNDHEMKSLEKSLRKKRDNFKTLRGLSLNETSKFFADITISDECKLNADHVQHDIDEYKYEYDFGNRYYYWPWYKNNENEDVLWNPGKTYRDLYIEKKYFTLKEEVLENQIFRVSVADYDRTYGKANYYLNNSAIIKQMRASTSSYGNCHYDIQSGDMLRIEHIMSIMLYTDHQYLALEFSKSFRKNNVNQSVQDYKKQKREYANWKRLIRETVELYGTTMEDNPIKTFYFGVSAQIVFHRYIEKLCGPLSTSPQLSVVMMFGQSDHGIILDLCQSSQPGNKLKCFNCSLLSCYGEEDEYLFIGGYAPIQIHSIRMVKTHKNYQRFLASLGYFDTILNGAYDINNKCTGSDFEIIKTLMKQLRSDIKVTNDEEDKEEFEMMRFPPYISKMFEQFVIRKESIYVDLQGLHWHYKSFITLLISSKCNNLVRFSFIASLFHQCHTITVKMLMYDSVSKTYIAEFLQDIERMNALSSKHMLKTIKLEMFRINVNQTKWKEFEGTMNALGCTLTLTGRGCEGYQELLIMFDNK